MTASSERDPGWSPERRASRTFYGVQVLRGVAACLVVVYHVTSNIRTVAGFSQVPELAFGSAGVDLFFLISGFVMVYTTQGGRERKGAWSDFLSRRLMRIVPLYWLLTSFKVLIVLAAPALFRNAALTRWNSIASYLFIPSLDARHHVSPVISAGWTLNYEMFFYVTFAACLASGLEPVTVMLPAFVVLVAVGLWHRGDWGPVASLLDPLLLEFVAGMVIGRFMPINRSARPSPLLIATGLIGALALVGTELDPAVAAGWARVLVWGLPSALLLTSFVALEKQLPFSRFRLPLLLGEASYSIYLTHVLILPALASRLRPLGGAAVTEWTGCCGLIIGGVGAGVIVYLLVERPLTRRVRLMFDARHPGVATVTAATQAE